jgi:hypothetical protein
MSDYDWAAHERSEAMAKAKRILQANLKRPHTTDWIVQIVLDDIWKAAQDSYARELRTQQERFYE